ncbi:putative L-aspartate 4-P-transferase [Mycosarcoma maydis]|uniref:aspartate kinase n=1 Tax=Mycosarcoma maydis TaxID=5270 RepID=A0A0D1CX31_MYCMD|nr:putative L-aspartate 4-P-transferase [Ustilago maydis 521]KIS70948.1 putative L-aspartate 4-P-transferase [Ustilago maydis 521]|eukprot:XP_011386893.1 putative L-aspartate 4-P-transferase [Ustilago maydis 521]
MPPTTHLRGPPDDPSAEWIIQKYGGTSVGKFLHTIAQQIVPSYLAGNKVAIVCSARSGQTKALGTTNLLLQAAGEALDEALTPAASLSNSVTSIANGAQTPVHRPGSAFSRKSSSRGTPLGRVESLSSTTLDNKLQQLTLNTTTTAAANTEQSTAAKSDAGSDSDTDIAIGFNATVDRILSDHLASARKAVINDRLLLEQLERDITEDCDRLRDFLLAAKIIEEISPKSKDIIIGVGERLSCRIAVGALRDAGVDAELVTLESIVDPSFSAHAVQDSQGEFTLDQTFYDSLSQALGQRLNACSGVPVVTGYFGNVPGSLLSQIGRGYTDLCAALCAVGVNAKELQIWKEVDGVFTADPRKVPTARLIPAITPEEAAELTYYGSEVIHPFTMEQAIKKAIPIRIKNVENPTGMGTVIFPDVPEGHDGSEDKLVDGHVDQPRPPMTPSASKSNFSAWGSSANAQATRPVMGERKLPTAVTIKDNVLVLNVHSNRKTVSHGFFAKIFGTLDKYGVVVDLISTSEVHVSMAMAAALRPRTLEKVKADLQKVGTVSVLTDMAILSLVGKHMRNMVGVAGRMFTVLADGNVNIEMISQGASEINISCVLHEKLAVKALNLIHYSVLEVSPKPSNSEAGAFGRSFF